MDWTIGIALRIRRPGARIPPSAPSGPPSELADTFEGAHPTRRRLMSWDIETAADQPVHPSGHAPELLPSQRRQESGR